MKVCVMRLRVLQLYCRPKLCYMKNLLLILLIGATKVVIAQNPQDSESIKQIYDEALKNGKSYEMLTELCTKIGPRLSGSPNAAAAVEWSRHMMEKSGFDS